MHRNIQFIQLYYYKKRNIKPETLEPSEDYVVGETVFLNATKIFERDDIVSVNWSRLINDKKEFIPFSKTIDKYEIEIFVPFNYIENEKIYLINLIAICENNEIVEKNIHIKYVPNKNHITLRFLFDYSNDFKLTYKIGNCEKRILSNDNMTTGKEIYITANVSVGYEGIYRGIVEDIRSIEDYTLYLWLEIYGKEYYEEFDFEPYIDDFNRIIWVDYKNNELTIYKP